MTMGVFLLSMGVFLLSMGVVWFHNKFSCKTPIMSKFIELDVVSKCQIQCRVAFFRCHTCWKSFLLPKMNVTFTEVLTNCVCLINEISVNNPNMLH